MYKKVTLKDISKDLKSCKDVLKAIGIGSGNGTKIYLHWSACRYNQVFNDYHLNILGNGDIIQTKEFYETPSATWKRNSGSIAITLSCCYGANSNNLGDFPPTGMQIETMSQLVAIIANILNIPITKEYVLTHGEAGDNEDGVNVTEPYGPKSTCERWDLEYLGYPDSPRFDPYNEEKRGGRILRGKAIWYLNHMPL